MKCNIKWSEFSEFSEKCVIDSWLISESCSLAYQPQTSENKMVFPTVHIAAYEFHFNIVVYPLPETEKKTVSVENY